jgi:hypothetical protein
MRCAECKAWEMRPDNQDFGYCKSQCPHPVITKLEENCEYVIVWPSTGKDDWCLQFKE